MYINISGRYKNKRHDNVSGRVFSLHAQHINFSIGQLRTSSSTSNLWHVNEKKVTKVFLKRMFGSTMTLPRLYASQ